MMGERETKGRGFAFAALDRTAAVSACMSLRVCAAGRVIALGGRFLRDWTHSFRKSRTPPRTGRFAGTDETLLVHGLVLRVHLGVFCDLEILEGAG